MAAEEQEVAEMAEASKTKHSVNEINREIGEQCRWLKLGRRGASASEIIGGVGGWRRQLKLETRVAITSKTSGEVGGRRKQWNKGKLGAKPAAAMEEICEDSKETVCQL